MSKEPDMADRNIPVAPDAPTAEDNPDKVQHGIDAVHAGTAAAAGAHDGDDIAGTEGAGPKGSGTFTVLHTLDHDGVTHLPGDTVTMSHLQAAELLAKRVLHIGTGKEAKAALETADAARESARLGG